MLNSRPDRLCLEPLACVNKLLHGEGIAQGLGQVIEHRGIAAAAFLMTFHHPRKRIHLPLVMYKCVQRIHAREGFKPEFRAEPGKSLLKVGKRFPAVPDGPVVYVTPVQVIRLVKPAARRGRGRPVETVRRLLFADFPQNALKLFQIVLFQAFRLFPHVSPFDPGRFHLIVAADQAEGRVMADPAQVVLCFPPDILPERLCHLIGIARKHQVLPDHQPVLVAQVVKII